MRQKMTEIGTKVFSPRIAVDPTTNNVYVVWHSGRIVQHARVKALISDIQYTRSTDNGVYLWRHCKFK